MARPAGPSGRRATAMPEPAPDARERVRRRVVLEIAVSAIYVLVASVIVGCLAGGAFDRWRGTSPAGLSVGLVIGSAAGFVELWRVAKKLEKT